MGKILELLPEQRNRGYDMHRLLSCIVDSQSLFPIKPAFGKSVITALARIDGGIVGLVANQPMFNAGAMDADGIDKVLSFLCLCDSLSERLKSVITHAERGSANISWQTGRPNFS